MIKIFVDSGSSIKQEEKEFYGIEILPLKILLNNKEYLDGIDLSMEEFYNSLINEGQFPKTSLPSLEETKERVSKFVNQGYEVIIITISSGISGTYNTMNMLFKGEEKVRVVDSQTAVGGIRILVEEANKHLDKPLDFVVEKINELIPRIKVLAVPETLDYLHKGGRLSKVGFIVGSILRIKPIIELKNTVKVAGKSIGLKSAMKYIISALDNCDTNYSIVPSYTYSTENLDILISNTDKKYQDVMTTKDNLDPAIACHWGPNAFGYIFVENKK